MEAESEIVNENIEDVEENQTERDEQEQVKEMSRLEMILMKQ